LTRHWGRIERQFAGNCIRNVNERKLRFQEFEASDDCELEIGDVLLTANIAKAAFQIVVCVVMRNPRLSRTSAKAKRDTPASSAGGLQLLATDSRMLRWQVSIAPLRYSVFAGEALSYPLAKAWRTAAPGSTVENLHWPTEAIV
jgi:hypothetical protein